MEGDIGGCDIADGYIVVDKIVEVSSILVGLDKTPKEHKGAYFSGHVE